MRNYHYTLTDGTENNVTASAVQITAAGALVFENANGEIKRAFAPGTWTAVETEAQDE